MAKGSGTNGRESGTGQDTHKVCVPVPRVFPATPCGARRDIVPSCPAVPPRAAKRGTSPFGSPIAAAPVLTRAWYFSANTRRRHERAPLS